VFIFNNLEETILQNWRMITMYM